MESFASFQTAAAQEAESDDQFDWILPEEEPENEVKEFNIASAPEKKKNVKGFSVFNAGLKREEQRVMCQRSFCCVFRRIAWDKLWFHSIKACDCGA